MRRVSFALSLAVAPFLAAQMPAGAAPLTNPCTDPVTLAAASKFDAAAYLSRTQGTWTGTARSVDRSGKQNAAPFQGSFSYSYDAEKNSYEQLNIYQRPGATEPVRLNFSGTIEAGILRINSTSYGNYSSCAWLLDNDTMLFYSSKTDFDQSHVETWEIITTISENKRNRNAQKIRNGSFDGMIMITETKGN
jgi:hypothetical protein